MLRSADGYLSEVDAGDGFHIYSWKEKQELEGFNS